MELQKSIYLDASMSMFISSINSGSNANCYYIGNQDEAILVDGGLSCRETVKRLKRLGLNIRNVKAIFVSHEHGDHIHGVPGLSKKFSIPVFITPGTLQNGRLDIREDLLFELRSYEPVTIGSLSITAFPKLHDASDPQSFIVECMNVKVGVFTDIGSPCEHVIRHFGQCHAAFLEANYDEEMLLNGRYPWHLKNRIRGNYGHMSNEQALELFLNHKPRHMTHLVLSHLSRENNSPKIVRNTFERSAGHTQIVIASRDRESKLYHIRDSLARIQRTRPHTSAARRMFAQAQLSLF